MYLVCRLLLEKKKLQRLDLHDYLKSHLSATTVTTILVLFCPYFSYHSMYDSTPPDLTTLSLHDALPILALIAAGVAVNVASAREYRVGVSRHAAILALFLETPTRYSRAEDRKSTRLNSSHRCISYAVFCLKKKNYNGSTCTITLNLTSVPRP